MKLGRRSETSARRPRRPRVASRWKSRSFRFAALVLGASLCSALVWWSLRAGWHEAAAEGVRTAAVRTTAQLGFTVKEVFVVGRQHTPADILTEALGVVEGMPILAIDLDDARARVLALPWVKSASIERLLPDTVLVRIVERTPLALWQFGGEFAVIDEAGDVILRHDVGAFSHLPVVVGEDAPAHAADLLRTLQSQPDLVPLVSAAVRVGGRRWNLRLHNGIDIRLPEQNPGSAWSRLAEYQRNHHILGERVAVVDLRLPDRLIVRKVPVIEDGKGQPARET